MSCLQWIYQFVTFLGNVFRNAILFYSTRYGKPSLQDEIHEEYSENNQLSARTENIVEEDTVDFSVTDGLKNSLDRVSEAIYKKFVSDWHSPPEELQNQPLYIEINSAIQSVFCNIQSRVRPSEEYEAIISIMTCLIDHFQNKRKKVTNRMKTRQEEVDFVRKNIRCLLDYWLPESIQRSQPVYVFLTEIISINVLEIFINYYSEFSNINEAIVVALDDKPATQQNEGFVKCNDIIQDNGCSAPDESNITVESYIKSRKKENKGIKQKVKGIFKRFRKRKPDKEASVFRACAFRHTIDDDNNDVADTDFYDGCKDSEEEVSSIIDTSLQKWLQNHWTAKVSQGPKEKEDGYEISVFDEGEPDTVLWNTERSIEDFKLIYDQICQKYPDFKIAKPEATTGPLTDTDRQFFDSVGTTPDKFINALLILIEDYKETEAVFFFSPFEYKDNVRELLQCAADIDVPDSNDEYFNDQFNTEEESSANSGTEFRLYCTQNETSYKDKESSPIELQDIIHFSVNRTNLLKVDESMADSNDPETDFRYQPDGINIVRSRKKHKKERRASPREHEDMPCTSVTRHEESENANLFNIQHQPFVIMNSNSQQPALKGPDLTGQDTTLTMEQQKKKLQETFLNVLYQLVDVVLAGGNSIVCFLHRTGFLKDLSKYILNNIPGIYAEEQIIFYLNQVSELLLFPVRPLQLPPDVLQSMALKLLKNKVLGSMTGSFLKTLIRKPILKHLEASHEALQDASANKATIFRLLEDLTKIITNDAAICNTLNV
ncbi:uncharacterized protein [Engystomops pustulosus]|uniref:uncharacterized protein isoform X1 n=1 Tax=Engystomops pustulosus TaxID=76066 RepID=UPI003AFB6CC1